MLYLMLAAVAIAIIAFLWPRVRLRTAVGLFAITGGLIGLADTLVHGILHLYTYRPRLLSKPQTDGPLGMLLADYLFVPALVSTLAAVPTRWRWLVGVGITLLMMLLERVFEWLGYYWRHGWPVVATLVFFGLFFAMAIRFVRGFEAEGYVGVYRWVLLSMTAIYGLMVTGVAASLVLGLWSVTPGLLGATFPDKVLGNNLFFGLPPFILTLMGASTGWGQVPAFYAAVAAGLALWTAVLNLLGTWHQGSFWNPPLQGLSLSLVVFGLLQVDQWFARRQIRVRGPS